MKWGNVEEIVDGRHAIYPGGTSTHSSVPSLDSEPVTRGGFWNSGRDGCQSAEKGITLSFGMVSNGVRLLRDQRS